MHNPSKSLVTIDQRRRVTNNQLCLQKPSEFNLVFSFPVNLWKRTHANYTNKNRKHNNYQTSGANCPTPFSASLPDQIKNTCLKYDHGFFVVLFNFAGLLDKADRCNTRA